METVRAQASSQPQLRFARALHSESRWDYLNARIHVYFTALNVAGLQVGAVHTAPGISEDADSGELDFHPRSIVSLVRRAKRT
jgi:hypothetical protein